MTKARSIFLAIMHISLSASRISGTEPLHRRPTQTATLCWLLFSLAAFGTVASAQSTVKDTRAADYSKEPFVYELISTQIVFENDGTESGQTTARMRIQSQAGVQHAGVLNFRYASTTSTMDIAYVRVIKPDKRIVETPAENVLDMPAEVTRQAPFYSDLKEKQIAVKGLEVGDTIEYQYRTVVKTPLDPGQFWLAYNFSRSAICLEEDLQISVPHNRYVKVESPKFQYTLAEQGAYKVYGWRTANLESNAEKKDAHSTEPDEATQPSVQITTFHDWNEVGQWFRSLVAPRAVPTAQIRSKADELTRNAKSDPEKIQAIYDYVSTRFRYIGISLGIGRYQPHAAEDVLSNDYGDCKDKHTLFAALLAAENIKAYPALISTASKIDIEVPSPAQFDHMITAVPEGNGFLFLDTTPEVAPFGYLIAELRDKETLVIPDDGPATLVKTPEGLPFKPFLNFQADGTLDDAGTFESKMQLSIRGDGEIVYRLAFRRAGQSQWKDVAQQISSVLGFSGTVSDVTAASPEATDAPFHIEYTYNRKEYGDWVNRSIVPPLPLLLLPSVPDDADQKLKPIELVPPEEWLYQGTMKLPAHSTPHAATPVDLHEDFADYHSSYSVSNGVMHFERRLTTKTHEIAPSQIEAYRKFVKAIIDDENTFISLRGENVASPAAKGSPEAQDLFAQGGEAWQQGNIPAAADAFQRAVGKDPKFSQGWWWLGAAHLRMGDADQAVEEMKKAISLDHGEVSNYKYLATTLMLLHREQEALEVWKQFEKQSPDDPDGPTNIGSILMRQKRYAEAIAELKVAANLTPNASVRLQLADAYILSGDKERGIAAIQDAVAKDAAPQTLNDAAYTLADNNLLLEDAFRYATKAVEDAEADTADIDLDDLSLKDVQTAPILAAYWDTLGWVNFRMGNLDPAEKFLRAAWSLTQNSLIADHLQQVYKKQGKTRDVPRDALALQELRTVKLGKLARKHVTAEFYLLFAPGPKVADVKFISGSAELSDAGKPLAAAKFDVPFPRDGDVQIIRRGILDCEPELPGCVFVLIPPSSVNSVN
jgi:tetratricopeptide (TPR) repeat protein/transglutaminase-like putative cysteine protease